MKFCVAGHKTENDDAAVCECGEGYTIALESRPILSIGGQTKSSLPITTTPPEQESEKIDQAAHSADLAELNIWIEPQGSEVTQDTAFAARLAEIEASGAYTIGIIGFSTSGKTFFVERLKDHYQQNANFGYLPRPAAANKGLELAGSTRIIGHKFEAREQDGTLHLRRNRDDFYIVDIPGEWFRRALDAGLQGDESAELLRVLQRSDALILVMSADDLLAPPRTGKQREEELDLERELAEIAILPVADQTNAQKQKFIKITRQIDDRERTALNRERVRSLIGNVAQIAEFARKADGADAQQRTEAAALSGEASDRANQKARGRAPITYFAIAKADLVVNPEVYGKGTKKPVQARLFKDRHPHIIDSGLVDSDPASLLRLHDSDLYNQIETCFALHKIDFITCFNNQPVGELYPNYERRSYGITEVVEWIHWARDHSRRYRQKPSRFRILSWYDNARLLGVRSEAKLAGWMATRVRNGRSPEWEKLGLAENYYSRRGEAARVSAVGNFLGMLMTEGSGLPRNIFLGASALFAAFIIILHWPWPAAEGERFTFSLQPVYAAEIKRMGSDVPAFATGLLDRRAEKFAWLPDDGGWFSINLQNPSARAPMDDVLSEFPLTGESWKLNLQEAQPLIESLKKVARQENNKYWTVTDYHLGLLYLRAGDSESAKIQFNVALDAISETLKNQDRRESDIVRVTPVRLMIWNALGLAQLTSKNEGDINAAVGTLGLAITTLNQRRGLFGEKGSENEFFYPVTTREPRNLANLETDTLWANYLAALIRQHEARLRVGNAQGAEETRNVLAKISKDLGETTEEDSAKLSAPLIANLAIAAARSGKLAGIAGIVGSDAWGRGSNEARDQAGQVQSEIATIQTAGPAGADNEQSTQQKATQLYWQATKKMRSVFDPKAVSSSAVATLLDEIKDDAVKVDVKVWLRDVLETEFHARGTDKTKLARIYGNYIDGAYYAKTVCGFWPAWILTLLMMGLLPLAWLRFPKIRESYRRLYEPSHHKDRIKEVTRA